MPAVSVLKRQRKLSAYSCKLRCYHLKILQNFRTFIKLCSLEEDLELFARSFSLALHLFHSLDAIIVEKETADFRNYELTKLGNS